MKGRRQERKAEEEGIEEKQGREDTKEEEQSWHE